MPSSPVSRDPLDDGAAPWTEQHTAALPPTGPEATRPLPTSGAGRTGVASGRLHPRDPDTGRTAPIGDEHLTPREEPITATAAWDTLRPATPPEGSSTPAPTVESVRARQKQRFGGLQVLPGLCGWLAAMSVSGVLLLATPLLGPWLDGVRPARGVGRALDHGLAASGELTAWTAVIAFGVIEFLALLVGGYVAGRMARFSAVAQGVSVWLWSLLARAAASVLFVIGSDTLGLAPHSLAAQSVMGSALAAGLIALAAVVILDLLAALLGAAWGLRYHRKVDGWTVSHAITR